MEFSEQDWERLTMLEQEGRVPGREASSSWAGLPLNSKEERVFIYPDIHFPFEDKLFLAYLDDQCQKLDPTVIVIIGDLLDCYSLSSFDKDPSRKETLNDERLAAKKWLSKLRRNHPAAEIIFIEGNHEERIRRQIKRFLPGLHDLPELTTSGLLGLEDFGISFCPSTGFKRWGIRFKHGTNTSKYSAANEMNRHRCSGVSGHTHRAQSSTFTDAEGYKTTWRSVGHACDLKHVEYVANPNWDLCGALMRVLPDGSIYWEYLEGLDNPHSSMSMQAPSP